jgi:tetratricopeptide (TPR) repeat protein
MAELPPATHDATLVAEESLQATLATNAGSRPRAELTSGALIGRYVVLSKLGAGGMGVVYAAHDPELDRKLALKLLLIDESGTQSSLADGRARLLREAQALAKLAHPHVVAIHDVGEHEGGVYLAMEFVEGQTLGAWLATTRSWREILVVMRAVGLGLVAAHDKGILHRDVKPDNIMVGNDDRVRVMDFGLARSGLQPARRLDLEHDHVDVAVTRVGTLLGTPAYMAPEQWAGGEIGPQADQFAFCVTLWEALYGERPFVGATLMELGANVLAGRSRMPSKSRRIPPWLRRACLRGLEREPERRWPSMQALVDELDRGHARVRRRRVLGGSIAIALLLLAAVIGQREEQARRSAACERAGAEIDELWNDDTRAAVHASLLATGDPIAEVTSEKLMPWLDEHARAWREARTGVCRAATIDETFDAQTHDKAVWCLEDRRLAMASFVDELERADVRTVHLAVRQAALLDAPSFCTEPELLARMPKLPPADARERAREVRAQLVRVESGRSGPEREVELELARAALTSSETLGYAPLTARARLVQADLFVGLGRSSDAEPLLAQAYFEAAKVSAWQVAASAATDLVYVVGERLNRPAEGKTWAAHAELALVHGGDPDGLREAERLTNLGLVLRIAGEDDESLRVHQRALALREAQLGPQHLEVGAALTNLANHHTARGEYEPAKLQYERVLGIYESALGSMHPDVANAVGNLAGAHYNAGHLTQADALYRRALAIQEKSLGPTHPHLAVTIANLANIAHSRGDYAAATSGFERALAIQETSLGRDHPNNATVLNNLGRALRKLGDQVAARERLLRALAIRETAFGLEHPNVATVETNLALVELAEGHHEAARARLARALAIRETAGPEHPHLAYTLDALAELALTEGRHADARSFAERAIAVRTSGKVAAELIAASRFLLARALGEAPPDAGQDRVRALELATMARDALRNGPPDELQRVEEWLAEHVIRPG